MTQETSRALLVWAGGAALALAFAALQSAYGCLFFQRGGAVLVAYGVLLGVVTARAQFDYAAELDALQSEQLAIAELLREEDRGRASARAQATHLIEKKMRASKERVAALQRAGRRTMSLFLVEAPIVLIGTLIWGFGDLFWPSGACALG